MAEDKEQQRNQPGSLHDSLRRELQDNLVFSESTADSLAYNHAALAVKAFADRGLKAAESVQKELDKQKKLDDGDPRRMPEDEVREYEDMMTQIETWVVTLPEFLAQARVVQTDPAVRERLWGVFDVINAREQFLTRLETMRFIVLKHSHLNDASPRDHRVPAEFYELAAIARVTWMIRQHLTLHSELAPDSGAKKNDPDLKSRREVFAKNVEQLSDMEVEGGWEVEDADVRQYRELDAFLIQKSALRFRRDTDVAREQRTADFQEFFRQGRIKVNGVIEVDPKRVLKKGDSVTIQTVFSRQTERVGAEIGSARQEADSARSRLNAERVTQGFPAVEKFAYTPNQSFNAWKRLLTASAPNERQRYARQFSESVGQFRDDFLLKGALKDFRKTATEEKDRMIKDNKKAKGWIKFFLFITGEKVSEEVADRFTTRPDEFEQVFQSTMQEMEKEFDAAATPERMQACEDLLLQLDLLQKGQQIDLSVLNVHIDRYSEMYRSFGKTITSLQAWQIRQNAMRVGGVDKPNNLDLVTRRENTSTLQSLRTLAPYGSFQPAAYLDEEGRIILIKKDPPKGLLGHGLEFGKIAAAGGAGAILMEMFARMPFLQSIPGFRILVSRIAAPVALAEGSLKLNEEMTRQLRAEIAARNIEQMMETLQALQKNQKNFSVDQRIQLATELTPKLRSDLVILLTAALRLSPTAQRADIVLEAHIYTNQVLSAFGLPPLSILNSGQIPESVDALKKQILSQGYKVATISPEVRQYIEMVAQDKSLEPDDLEKIRQDFLKLRQSIEGGKGDPVAGLQRGLLPSRTLDRQGKASLLKEMQTVRDSKNFEQNKLSSSLDHFGSNEQERIQTSYHIAGSIFHVFQRLKKMDDMLKREKKREVSRKDIDPIRRFSFTQRGPLELVRGGKDTFNLLETELELKKIMGEYTVADILAASRLIASNPPSDEVLAREWLRDASFTGNRFQTQFLSQRFGDKATRKSFADTLLTEWNEVYDYYERGGLTAAYDATKEVNLTRFDRFGFRLFKLPGEYWMVIKPDVFEGASTGGLLLEIGENSGKGDGRSVHRGEVIVNGKKSIMSPETPELQIDSSQLFPGAKISINDGDGNPLVKDVPLLVDPRE